jgi:hypothetical protein
MKTQKVQKKHEIFSAADLPNLNMSGMYAESIQNTHINRFGQMVYPTTTEKKKDENFKPPVVINLGVL